MTRRLIIHDYSLRCIVVIRPSGVSVPLVNQPRFRRVNIPFSQVIKKSVHYFGQKLIGRAVRQR